MLRMTRFSKLGMVIIVKADKIIHFGHAPFANLEDKIGIPVEYKEYHIDIDLNLIKANLGRMKNFEKIGLVTTVQHIHQLGEMKKLFENIRHLRG